MSKVLISEQFIQLNKPCNYKMAFLEVLSQLDENYNIDAYEYRDILDSHDILTLDMVGIEPKEGFVHFDIIKIKQEYDVNISRYTHKVQELKDAERTNLILTNYNKVLMQYYAKNSMHNATPRTYKKTDNKYFNNLIEFFDSNRIEDSYNYFHTLFSVKDWKQIWPFPRCVTNEALSLYQKHGNRVKEQEQTANLSQTTQESRWLGVFDHIESKKRFYASRKQAEVCLNSLDATLGYHPKSQYCQKCPLAGECMKQTNELFSQLARTDIRLTDLRFETPEVAQKRLPTFDLFQ